MENNEYIPRHEHEEFRRSMDEANNRLKDEDVRQNHRLDALERTVEQIAAISTSVEKLAVNMKNMLDVQIAQGKRLTTLESRDGEKWRDTVKYVLTTVLGIVIGILANKIWP